MSGDLIVCLILIQTHTNVKRCTPTLLVALRHHRADRLATRFRGPGSFAPASHGARPQASNRSAGQIAREAGASACTDVTGFGLLGHLAEMLDESPGVGVELGEWAHGRAVRVTVEAVPRSHCITRNCIQIDLNGLPYDSGTRPSSLFRLTTERDLAILSLCALGLCTWYY